MFDVINKLSAIRNEEARLRAKRMAEGSGQALNHPSLSRQMPSSKREKRVKRDAQYFLVSSSVEGSKCSAKASSCSVSAPDLTGCKEDEEGDEEGGEEEGVCFWLLRRPRTEDSPIVTVPALEARAFFLFLFLSSAEGAVIVSSLSFGSSRRSLASSTSSSIINNKMKLKSSSSNPNIHPSHLEGEEEG